MPNFFGRTSVNIDASTTMKQYIFSMPISENFCFASRPRRSVSSRSPIRYASSPIPNMQSLPAMAGFSSSRSEVWAMYGMRLL